MPLLKLASAKETTPEQRKRLIERLTMVVLEELAVPLSSINVLIEDVPPSHWGVGGTALDEVFAALASHGRER